MKLLNILRMLYRNFKRCLLVLLGSLIASVVIAFEYSRIVENDFWRLTFKDFLGPSTAIFIGVVVAYFLKNQHSDHQIAKNLFLGIADDISEILENQAEFITNFMKANPASGEDDRKVRLILRKINNKIDILEQHKLQNGAIIATLIDAVKIDYAAIKEIIFGDDYVSPKAFSDESITKVLKKIDDLEFKVDQIKLKIFF